MKTNELHPHFVVVMGDNHVASFTSSMNLVGNSLPMSCLIVAT
jgi:hypothetical protein